MSAYGKYCYRMLEKMRAKGAKKGLKKPALDEVIHARNAPFNPTSFGVTLEDIMDLQKEKYPHLKIPWIQKSLCDYVIRLSGHITEGIFRYAFLLALFVSKDTSVRICQYNIL